MIEAGRGLRDAWAERMFKTVYGGGDPASPVLFSERPDRSA